MTNNNGYYAAGLTAVVVEQVTAERDAARTEAAALRVRLVGALKAEQLGLQRVFGLLGEAIAAVEQTS